jgi:hypothetical protein
MRNDKAVQAAVLNILYRELARKVFAASALPSPFLNPEPWLRLLFLCHTRGCVPISLSYLPA